MSDRQYISDEEFAGPGGGSRRLSDKTKGPDKGYYVSVGVKKGKTPAMGGGLEESVSTGDGLVGAIASHYSRSQPFLDSLPESHKDSAFQGKWVPKVDGSEGDEATLDISKNMPSRHAALLMGIEENQKAIWDAKRGATPDPTTPGKTLDGTIGVKLSGNVLSSAARAAQKSEARKKARYKS